MRQMIDGNPLAVFGDGSQTRSFCYIDDLTQLAVCGEHTAANTGKPAELSLVDRAVPLLGWRSTVPLCEGLRRVSKQETST